jgi:hypothetical protein
MTPCLNARSLFFASLIGTLALSGCGMDSTSFGVVGEPVGQSSPPLQGSVFGGHAPLAGARVYILQPSTTGNPNDGQTGLSTSLMLATGTGTGLNKPTLDTVSGSAGNSMYYVTTDNYGGYNLTGNYACNQNYPVYLAAVGGSPSLNYVTANAAVTSVALAGTLFTYTTSAAHGYSTGEYVAVTGFTGTNGTYYNRTGFVTVTGTKTFTITAVATTGSGTGVTAAATAAGYPGWNPSAINLTSLGLCPTSGNFSTAGTGNGAISFIYTNEVSTAAMAMATGAFGADAFHVGVATGGTVDAHYNDLYDLNAMGLAFNNAGLLYDITGGDLTTAPDGEGHIARSVTPNGNGVVPQALMNTLGNILAACVDSGNTGTTSNVAAQCGVLFSNATSTGKACTGGSGGAPPTCPTGTTAPTDTAAAAFNIAHHPAGDPSNTSFVSNLYSLQTGVVPFTPNLSADPTPNGQPAGQPNDFTATIAFTVPKASGSTANNLINQPQVISIDGGSYVGDEYGTGITEANGDFQEGIWIGNFGSQAVKLFANGGIPDYTVNSAIANATYGSRSVTIDANTTTENVFFTNPNAPSLVEYSIGGTAVTSYNPGTGNSDAFNIPLFAALDGSGNTYDIYVPQFGANNLLKITQNFFGSGTALANIQYYNAFGFDFYGNNAFSTTTPCLSEAASAVLNPAGTLYTYGEQYGDVCTINTTTGNVATTQTGFTTSILGPAFFSIDHANNLWGTNADNNTVISYKAGGSPTAFTGGGLNEPCSTAVDGAGNIWVGNAGTYSVSEFTGAGVAMSPPAHGAVASALGGYSPQLNSTYTVGGTIVFNPSGGLSNCASPAIDRAGNVWVVYQGNSGTLAPGVVFEILGVAAPTVTPLSYATFGSTAGYLGVRP